MFIRATTTYMYKVNSITKAVKHVLGEDATDLLNK